MLWRTLPTILRSAGPSKLGGRSRRKIRPTRIFWHAWLAAAAAVLATCQGHLRGLYAQLSNRFVVSFSTTGFASVAMGEYLSREFTLSKFSRTAL